MGQLNTKTSSYKGHPASNVHLREKKDLAGVGIIFRKGTDGSLVVKEVVGGSSAEECMQIEAGDTLTQVDDVKIKQVSIAEVSGMILGEPSAPVKLKFNRVVGKKTTKYKVLLRRNVRATLEPTYRVQRDGINTKVTHIHLDCLQVDEESPTEQHIAAEQRPAKAVRDVLDASGNVVGPGLLQRKTASILTPAAGVEKWNDAHPAHPNHSKVTSPSNCPGTTAPILSASTSSLPFANPERRPSNLPMLSPKSQPQIAHSSSQPNPSWLDEDETNTNDLLDEIMFDKPKFPKPDRPQPPPSQDQPIQQGTTFAMLPAPISSPPASSEIKKSLDVIHTPEPPPPPVHTQTDSQPAVQQASVTTELEHELIEEQEDTGEPDWAGLAESRVLAFEAKSKAQGAKAGKAEAAKAVDLEKEWARTAAAKQQQEQKPSLPAARQMTPAKQREESPPRARAPSPPRQEVERAPSPVLPVQPPSKTPEPVKAPEIERKPSFVKMPLSKDPVKSTPVADKPKDPPKKLGVGGPKAGGGDLAAMMAARKKQMDENEDDGYYF